ncbi:MAG TPA: CRISPR-associated endonuclease Cas1 [Erysipelothrix sp.]
MTCLYVDRKNVHIKTDSKMLSIYDDQKKITSVPLQLLSRICLKGNITLTASVLGKLGECDIGILILRGLQHKPTLLLPTMKHDANKRLIQAQLANNIEFCLSFAKTLVQQKIERQCQTLQSSFERVHFPHSRQLELDKYYQNTMMEIENAQQYEWIRQIHLMGLDPYIGFYHQIKFGRESLACDLVEPLRALYDLWLINAFKEKIFRMEDFTITESGCTIGKAGRLRFYNAFENWLSEHQNYFNDTKKMLFIALNQKAPLAFDVSHTEIQRVV